MRDFAFFSWVSFASISLSDVWQNDLDVAFWAESTTLQKSDFVFHTSLIDVLPGLDIIKCVRYDVQWLKELIGEGLLCVFADSIKFGSDFAF